METQTQELEWDFVSDGKTAFFSRLSVDGTPSGTMMCAYLICRAEQETLYAAIEWDSKWPGAFEAARDDAKARILSWLKTREFELPEFVDGGDLPLPGGMVRKRVPTLEERQAAHAAWLRQEAEAALGAEITMRGSPFPAGEPSFRGQDVERRIIRIPPTEST